MTGARVFLDACGLTDRSASLPLPQYPDRIHLLFWRRYHRRIFERTRARFEKITTEQIVAAERATWPYYQAMALADADLRSDRADSAARASADAPNVFAESDQAVCDWIREAAAQRKLSSPRILEIGCGDGRLLKKLRSAIPNSELVGTNVFESNILLPEVASDSKTRVLVASLQSASLEPESFDFFVSTEVMEHLVQPAEMVRAAKRLLKPGGGFIISAPSVHVQMLSKNPLTYAAAALSVKWRGLLPPFHNLYEPLTPLKLVHYGFSVQEWRDYFRSEFPEAQLWSMRFTHLRKFRLERVAARLPLLKDFGGLLVAAGFKEN